jgi:SNF2 family DNA or RNA helicase
MGLGKTIQMIGVLLENFKLHTLIVLPRALLEQWESICIKTLGHTPLLYHGSKVKHITLDTLSSTFGLYNLWDDIQTKLFLVSTPMEPYCL